MWGPGMSDHVNHPSHYTAHPSGVECIAITEHMNFCLGNAVKYIWRSGLKSATPVEDLEKARWYIERELHRLGDRTDGGARAERDEAIERLQVVVGEAKATAKQKQAIDERYYALERLMVVMEERDEARAMMNRIRTALAHYSGREDDSLANDHSGNLTPSGDAYMKVMSEAMRQHWPPQWAAAPCGETAPGPCAGHHSEPDVCQGCDRRSEFEHCGPQSTMESE